ncbi:hypothetical protein AGMMS49543_17420 [Betaproteobacteria bacterium]|nr:hypothetical protein AGMMS49543_17420 [Betaproteobacteria bacterium]GHU21613.1 hypothetical protein AGMMS50243_19640 [Betaproteobacteria bacterium]
MDEVRYTILFDGVTLAGMPERTVKANLVKLLKREFAEVDAMFTGSSKVLKTGLSAQEADSFIQALREAGAIARKSRLAPPTAKPVKPVTLALTDEPPPRKPSEFDVGRHGVEEVIYARGSAAAEREAPRATSANSRRAQRVASSDYAETPPIFSLEGRLGRIRFIGWQLGWLLLFALLVLGIGVLVVAGAGKLGFGIMVLSGLASLAFYISITVRRLHDLNLSGWWLLVWLIVMIIVSYLVYRGAAPALSSAIQAQDADAYVAARDAMANSPIAVISSVVNFILGLFLLLKGGSKDGNDYGDPPSPNGTLVTLLAGIVIVVYVGGILWGYKQQKALERQLLENNAAAEKTYVPQVKKPDYYRPR